MTATSRPCSSCISRRTLLAVAVGGVGAALAGCASYGDQPGPPVAAGAAPTPTPAGPGPSAAGGNAPAAARLVALADVPVGGGIILEDENIVVTQPTEGTVLAFSATCTHAGCTIDDVSDGLIRCPCHGSVFDMTTGAPTAGPAEQALPAVAVTVDGADVVLG